MTSRERVLRALNHKIPDRVPIHDSPWGATVDRWRNEGLPKDISPAEFFDYDLATVSCDLSPRFPVRTLERTDEYVVQTTPYGGKRRNHRDFSTTPEIVDWPIKKKDDWKEVKKRLKPDFTRVDWATVLANNARQKEEGKFIAFWFAHGYDLLQSYVKSEQLLMAMVDDPGWVKDMVMTHAELAIVMAELMLSNGVSMDACFVGNDMGYRNGLLFSPDTYMKTHFEADRLIFTYFHSKGMKTILHSCGQVKNLIPTLIEAGLDCLQPLEVKAGMDVRELKKQYGDRLAFMGGIDVRLMSEPDPSKIEEEIRGKFEVAKQGGGYIYHSDHSVPKNVSFAQYQHVMELVRTYGVYPEYSEVAAEQTPEPAQKPAAPAKQKRGLFGGRKK